jgi:hypothetical protein
MAVMTETAVMMETAVMTETVVMTETYQRESWFLSSVSEVRIMWNITPPSPSLCQGTPAAYPPVTGQGRLNRCGSAKAG